MFGIVSNIVIGLLRSIYGLTASVVSGTINTVVAGTLIVRQATGTAGTDEIQISHDGTHATLNNAQSGGTIKLIIAGAAAGITHSTNRITIDSTSNILWDPAVNAQRKQVGAGSREALAMGYSSDVDRGVALQYVLFGITNAASVTVGVEYAAAGVLKITDANTGTGWLQNSGGVSRVASDVTNDTVTPANITGLSATLGAGRKYTGVLALKVSNTTAADGLRLDFDGGTATMTSFDAGVTSDGLPAATFSVSQSEALATDIIATTVTDTNARWITIHFAMVVNAAGTFIPRIALEADSGGIITVHDNSYMWIEDTP